MYNEIKKNFIERFVNVHFRYSVVSVKKHVISKMNDISPFEITPVNKDVSVVSVNLGNDVKFDLNLIWSENPNGKCTLYKLVNVI